MILAPDRTWNGTARPDRIAARPGRSACGWILRTWGMGELQEILLGIRAGLARGEALTLATVVRVEGSAYRHPGARLLLGSEGPRIGCVSGGCLEGDLQIRAAEVRAEGRARLLRYDLRGDLDLIWGTGSGCEGVAEVLLEPVLPGLAWIDAVETALAERRTIRLGTLLEVPTGSGWSVGQHLVLEAGEALPAGCDGIVERIEPPIALWILGAGDDARPLARLAKALGHRVGIADHRPAFANAERFPDAAEVLCGLPAETIPRMSLDARSAVVLLTHQWERDREALRLLLPSPVAYLGLLGHRRRGTLLLESLAEDGFAAAPQWLARLYSPTGLDLGGQEPETIALAILAEVEAVLAGRSAGHLRDRRAPIHG